MAMLSGCYGDGSPPAVDHIEQLPHTALDASLSVRQVRQLIQEELRRAMACQAQTMARMMQEAVDKAGAAKEAAVVRGLAEQMGAPFPSTHSKEHRGSSKDELWTLDPDSVGSPEATRMEEGRLAQAEERILMDVVSEMQLDHKYSTTVHPGVDAEARKSPVDIFVEKIPLLSRPARTFEKIYNNVGAYDAPPSANPICRFVDGNIFASIINIVIFFNCIFMWIEADSQIDEYTTGESSQLIANGERIFVGVYTAEFLLKIFRHRLRYFYDTSYKYNLLDFILLLLSWFFVLSDTKGNVGFLRMLRLLKLTKALRIFRLVAVFRSLQAILTSILSTLDSLVWSVMALSLIHFLFALILVLRVAAYFQGEQADGKAVDPIVERHLLESFGSVTDAILALVGTGTGGDGWPTLYHILEPTGWGNQVFLLVFVAFSQIAILNIILGIFVDHAMKALQVSKEEAALEHQDEEAEIEENIRKLCMEADQDSSGKMDKSEWQAALRRGEMQSYLDLVGLRVYNVVDYFNTLLSANGEVDVEEFVKGCMRMKGSASGFDMQIVLHEVQSISKKLERAAPQC